MGSSSRFDLDNVLVLVALVVLLIGGIQHGVQGVFEFDTVGTLFGAPAVDGVPAPMTLALKVVYICVGLSALFMLWVLYVNMMTPAAKAARSLRRSSSSTSSQKGSSSTNASRAISGAAA